ncbi:ABC transporter ATP-binding protein, partial [Clostridium perfringens]|nr:ABC transporter ATP-binding protein [Clostridium perfringens]
MLKVKNFSLTLNEKMVLENINFSVERGKVLGIV